MADISLRSNTFLGGVALACCEHFGDLSDFCFIFPSRRAGTFFLKHLSQLAGNSTMVAPEVLAVGDFMSRVAQLDVAPRITQLMELYREYCALKNGKIAETGTDEDAELMEFDKFLPWGEIVLSDFSEIDMYDADTERLFKNVRDFNDISANYLDEEQRKMLERFFNYSMSGVDEERMWRNFSRTPDTSVLKQQFLQLWQVLPELYAGIHRRLLGAKVPSDTAGGIFRRAMQLVLDKGMAAIPWKHVVVVGLDSMSTTEVRLYSELKKAGEAADSDVIDFFWDLTGPVLTDSKNTAGIDVRVNMSRDRFPMSPWAEKYIAAATRRCMPALTEIGVPGNVMQTKVAGDCVRDMLANDDEGRMQSARVAVVLPDEDLLLPLLHSLPFESNDDENGENGEKDGCRKAKGLKSVNLTMGWSMRYTSTAAMMYHLERIQHRRVRLRADDGRLIQGFLTPDVRLLIGQPLVQMLVGIDTVMSINAEFDNRKMRTVSVEWLRDKSTVLAGMLEIEDCMDTDRNVAWLEGLLHDIDACLAGSRDGDEDKKNKDEFPVKTSIERMQLQVYLTALNQIRSAAARAGVQMNMLTLFHLLSRMVSGETISFEGKPLEGLQVMGLLETRALDFDDVIVLSMNDKVMPARAHKRSFIPEAMRRGYGLPGLGDEEKRYTYWFYRLLSRAGNATLIYDSRVGEGMRSGGKSRFLMQLEKLFARTSMKIRQCVCSLKATEQMRGPLAKTDEMMKRLENFRCNPDHTVSEGQNLSASALATYMKCGRQFYYRYVLKYNDDKQATDSVDNITMGNIFHNVMQNLYLAPDEQRKLIPEGKEVTEATIDALLANPATLQRLVRRAVNKEYFKRADNDLDHDLPVTLQQIADRVAQQVRQVLLHDKKNTPFRIYGSEIRNLVPWRVSDDLWLNVNASFDRVDDMGDNLRIVDFKTGKPHVTIANGLESIWNAEFDASNALQLLLYARLLEERAGRDGVDPDLWRDGIRMVIYSASEMHDDKGERFLSFDKNGRNPILTQNNPAVQDFVNELNEKISEIFSQSVDFSAAADIRTCRNCPMVNVCGDKVPDSPDSPDSPDNTDNTEACDADNLPNNDAGNRLING